MAAEPILTARLAIEPADPAVVRMLLDGDRAAAESALGAALPPGFDEERVHWLRRHLSLMERYPDRRGWCGRFLRLRASGELVGHCGFHGPPEAVGRPEIGYTVFEPYRRRGYATEAARALVEWGLEQGAAEVFASVSPDNEASLAIVRGLGFREVGVQEDPVDGTELVFTVAAGQLRPLARTT